MKKNILLFASSIILFFCIDSAFAAKHKIKCPSVSEVKAVKFIHAKVHPYDPTCWNLNSAPFTDSDGNSWNVTFGSFFPTAKNQEEVLKQGQAYFDQSPLVFKHPPADEIPPGIILCDYMPTGRPYWVSALNPPQYEVAGRK